MMNIIQNNTYNVQNNNNNTDSVFKIKKNLPKGKDLK